VSVSAELKTKFFEILDRGLGQSVTFSANEAVDRDVREFSAITVGGDRKLRGCAGHRID
jgi:hypothetical protein